MEFIGFRAELNNILDRIEERFRKGPTADRLQQEFYLLQLDKGKKIQYVASRLEQKYRNLEEKFPDRYNRKQLKYRIFYGLHQHLWDLMHFFYKQNSITYDNLLSATWEAQTERTENKVVPVRVKAASVDGKTREQSSNIMELGNKIESLTTVIKSSAYNGVRPKGRDHRGRNKTKATHPKETNQTRDTQ